MKYRFLFLFPLFIVYVNTIQSQFALNEHAKCKFEDEKLQVRWEPFSLESWKVLRNNSYRVVVYKGDPSNSEVIEERLVRPWSAAEWKEKMLRSKDGELSLLRASIGIVHPEAAEDDEMESFLALIEEHNPGKLDSFRYAFLATYASLNKNVAKASGLYTSFDIKSDAPLTVKIFEKKVLQYSIPVRKMKEESGPNLQLNPEWGDRTVLLKWQTTKKSRDIFSYQVYKSKKMDVFEPISNIPMIAPSYSNKKSESTSMEWVDSLRTNDQIYKYKVSAFDVFGDQISLSNTVEGQGARQFLLSPHWRLADQLETNEAHLVWEMPASELHRVNHYSIMHSTEEDGEYSTVEDSIPSDISEVKIPMKDERNFFRVLAHPKRGKATTSFPVFVMGVDTIPPETPQLIDAVADKEGLVTIRWTANQEEDLWGYKLLWANDTTEEFSLCQAEMIKDTFYVDTVSMSLRNEIIYYRLQAADDRNNTSELSAIIPVQKVDIHPPTSAFLHAFKQRGDSLQFQIGRSGSKDVVTYDVYYRGVSDSTSGWLKALSVDSSKVRDTLILTNLEKGKNYAFTVQAIDDSDLVSPFSKLKLFFMEEEKREGHPLNWVRVDYDSSAATIELSWEVKDGFKVQDVLLYRGQSKDKIGKYKYLDAAQKSYTEKVDKDWKEVHYYLKPSWTRQRSSYYSPRISIDMTQFDGQKTIPTP